MSGLLHLPLCTLVFHGSVHTCTCIQQNKKFFQLRKTEYRDGIKMIGDKTGMAFVHSGSRCANGSKALQIFEYDISPLSSQRACGL